MTQKVLVCFSIETWTFQPLPLIKKNKYETTESTGEDNSEQKNTFIYIKSPGVNTGMD